MGLNDLTPAWGPPEYKMLLQFKKVSGFEKMAETLSVEKKVTKYDERLVLLCRNYLIWYEQKKGEVKGDAAPAGYIRLDTSSVHRTQTREDLTGMWPKKESPENAFTVQDDHDASKAAYFKCADREQFDKWYNTLKDYMPKLKAMATQLHKHGKGIDVLSKLIKMPIRIEVQVRGEHAREAAQKLRETREAMATWKPILKMFKRFWELYHEKSMDYIDWFTATGTGLIQELTDAEDAQLAFWKKKFNDIATLKEKIATATEVSFFVEDFDKTVAFCRGHLSMLEEYEAYRGSVLKVSNGNEHPEMRAKLEALIKFLQSFPSSADVHLYDGYEKAAMKVGADIWEFEHMRQVQEGHVEVRHKDDETRPFFTCGGFEIASQAFGTVLWNKSSWVWYHPELPFTIRYNFKKNDNLFAFHTPKGELKGVQQLVLPSWKWNGKNGLQPVMSANATLDASVKPNFASVVVGAGSAPLPVVLLVAMMKHIEWTLRETFGF